MTSSNVLESLRSDRPHKDDSHILIFQKGGYVVTVGKNAFSNEKMISEHPHRTCVWLHATAARGSHVILCIHAKPEPEDEVLQYAASLALKHSNSEARTVSISLLHDLFKPEDASIGVWKTHRRQTIEVL